jgi:hypothetical protein
MYTDVSGYEINRKNGIHVGIIDRSKRPMSALNTEKINFTLETASIYHPTSKIADGLPDDGIEE